jgi:ubiquinone/menaquinone biosynthesis C-methylase UbiE
MIKTMRNVQHKVLDWVIDNSPWVGLERRAEDFISQFEDNLGGESAHILDVGAGPGKYYLPLQNRGHQVTLLDVAKYESCPHPVTYFDGGNFPFEDNSFDASLLITMLHHTKDPDQILREAARVTRKRVIVIEDIYDTYAGRQLCKFRDAALNFEWIDHPMNFRSHKGWIDSFQDLGMRLVEKRDFTSYLMKLPIRTGLYVLEPPMK